MSLTVAMVQSSYIPWKGYFEMILKADRFVFYDDVQFTKEDWRNRNQIKTKDGLKWLTVPCGQPKGRDICDVKIESDYWQRKHWDAIRHAYAKAPAFNEVAPFFEELYLSNQWNSLSAMNQVFTRQIAQEWMGSTTQFTDSRDYPAPPDLAREERWISMLEKMGATRFLIGPKARNYLSDEKAEEIRGRGIELVWMNYDGYREYPQLHPPFVHQLSVIDLLFNCGHESRDWILDKSGDVAHE
jgi:hypothetical protein